MRVIFINDYNSFSIVWTGERSRGGRCRQNSSRPVVCTVITCAADGKILNAPIVRNHMVTLWSPWKQSWDLLTCEQRLEAETSWKWIYFNADPLHQEEEEKNMVSLWMRACSPVKNLLWGDRWCPPGICSRLESPPYQPTESSAEGHTPVSRRKHPGKKRKQEAMRGGGGCKGTGSKRATREGRAPGGSVCVSACECARSASLSSPHYCPWKEHSESTHWIIHLKARISSCTPRTPQPENTEVLIKFVHPIRI